MITTALQHNTSQAMMSLREIVIDYNKGKDHFEDTPVHGCYTDGDEVYDSETLNTDDACTREIVRSRAPDLFETALINMARRSECEGQTPPSDAELELLASSLACFLAACQIAKEVGEWLKVTKSPDLQVKLLHALEAAVERLQSIYDLPMHDIESFMNKRTFTVALNGVTIALFETMRSTDAWLRLIESKSTAVLACTIWARHFESLNVADVYAAAGYLRCLRWNDDSFERDKEAMCQVFGDDARFARSLTTALRHGPQLDINTFRWSKMMVHIVDTLTLLVMRTQALLPDARVTLRRHASPELVALMNESLKRTRIGIETKKFDEACDADEVMYSSLWLLHEAFKASDGELWAIGPLKKGLLSFLYSFDDILPCFSVEFFQKYQDVVLTLIPLSRKERLFKVILPTVRKIWKEEGYYMDQGTRERKLFENEVSKLALVRRLRQNHWTPFDYACCNVSSSFSVYGTVFDSIFSQRACQ